VEEMVFVAMFSFLTKTGCSNWINCITKPPSCQECCKLNTPHGKRQPVRSAHSWGELRALNAVRPPDSGVWL